MGKLQNKFLDAFHIGNKDDDYDDEYDDEYLDEDYDDDEDERTGLFGKKKSQAQPQPQPSEPKGGIFSKPAPKPVSTGKSEVCIFKPTSIEDSREITETLLEGKAVVVNFEGLHVEISQRIIDFISGSTYALDGNLQKISNYIFIATPHNVDISGDYQELFSGSTNGFDVAGFKSTLL